MKTKNVLLIGCGSLLGLGLLVAVAVVVFFWHAGQDPKGIAVSVEAPSTVSMKDEFTVTVSVTNQREKGVVGLTDVDVAEDYLAGFLLLETEPKPRKSIHVPIDNKRSYTYDRSLKPGETARFAFKLRAVKKGIFRGDVDVCEGVRFLTTEVQTQVE